jgi:hypothetical protein
MNQRLRLTSVAALVGLTAAFNVTAQTGTESAGDLPQASTLISNALGKVGSAENRAEIESLTMNGTIKMSAMDESGGPEVESFVAKLFLPDKYHLTASFTGGESAIAAHNGEVGWQSDPGDPSFDLMDESEAAMFSLIVPHMVLLNLEEFYPNQETKEVVEIDGAKHYRISASNADETDELQIFVNAETGQFSAIESADPNGFPVRLTITGWEEAVNLNLPAAAVLALGMGEEGPVMTLGYADIAANNVDESTFAVPDEVKRQLEEDDGGNAGSDDGAASAGAAGSGST